MLGTKESDLRQVQPRQGPSRHDSRGSPWTERQAERDLSQAINLRQKRYMVHNYRGRKRPSNRDRDGPRLVLTQEQT